MALACAGAAEPPVTPPPTIDHAAPAGDSFHEAVSAVIDAEVAATVAALRQQADASPNDVAPRGRLAMTLDANGFTDDAAAAYQHLTRLDASNPRWWFHLARLQAERGEVMEGLDAIEQAIALAPQRCELLWRRGMMQLDAGLPEQAEASARAALLCHPQDQAATIILARALLQRESAAQAATALEGLLARDPNHRHARTLLSTAYRLSGRIEESTEQARLGAGTGTTLTDDWERDIGRFIVGHRAVMMRAQLLMQRQRPLDAIPLLQDARARRPDDVSVLLTLAAAYGASGRLDDAERLLRGVDASLTDHYAVRLNLSRIKAMQGELAAAHTHAAKAAAVNPHDPACWLQLARVRLALGDTSDARRVWEAAHASLPNHPDFTSFASMMRAIEAGAPPHTSP
jgi:predicted Zn-dependent protease